MLQNPMGKGLPTKAPQKTNSQSSLKINGWKMMGVKNGLFFCQVLC